MSIGNDIVLCPNCEGKKGNKKCPVCKGEGRTFTWIVDIWDRDMVNGGWYWKKRYEKLLEIIHQEFPSWDRNEWRELVEEEIEEEEIEHEGTVEDAKVRKELRHDTP